MYTRPQDRGRGLAGTLIDQIIHHAKSQVLQLHLMCVISNIQAIKLYQSKGFEIYGTEPQALKVREDFFDEYLMINTFTVKS